jgi:hypothetical protein
MRSAQVVYAEAIALLSTRREVRGCLAKEVEAVIQSCAAPQLPAELAELFTGSDREVIQTSQRLEKSFGRSNVARTSSTSSALGCLVRDLFTEALQRMKELPPDPRETMQANVQAIAGSATSVKRR